MSYVIEIYNTVRNADQLFDIARQPNPSNAYQKLFQITQIAVATLDIFRSLANPGWDRWSFHNPFLLVSAIHLFAGALVWRDNNRKMQCQTIKAYISMFSIFLSQYSPFQYSILASQYFTGAFDLSFRAHSLYEHYRSL